MTLEALKNFLADRPEYAFLTLLIMVVVVLWRAYRRAEAEKLEIALRVLPLADKLQAMLAKASERRARSLPSPPTGGGT